VTAGDLEMDLWQLNIFCKVVEQKSFSEAGQVVHLSQPTVSSHIKELEEYFDCRLIDRLPKGAIPTKAGELLYEYGKRLLVLKDDAETAMFEFNGKIKGRLAIGGSTIPSGYILPKIIGEFKAVYPQITIALVAGDTEKTIKDILDGTIELGIVGAKTHNKRIYQEPFIQDEMRLVIPAGHKWKDAKEIGLDQLTSEPFIVREAGSGTLKSLKLSLAEKNFDIDSLNIMAEMGSTAALIQAVKNHVGVSIFSTIAIDEYLSAGTLIALPVKGLNLRRNFYLTTHKDKSLSSLASAFIIFTKESIKRKNA